MGTTPEATQPNPYVGPRPFSTREREFFFGREREIAELRDLLIARRVALLFSPSGAGKTSLVQAGLVPDLCDLGYAVLPTLRVNGEVPPELRQAAPNRYLFSVLVSLEESLPDGERLPLAELAGMSLEGYLGQRRAGDICSEPGELDLGRVLIFDQFEELLSLDPTDVGHKQAFLRALAPVLRDPGYFALFSMREDYVASLEPYLRLVPDHLATRYRIDLLSEKVALEAVRRPARQVKPPVDFHQEAAAELIDDLRQMRLQGMDGSVQLVPGPNIEPIMLQVVCQRLWDNRSSPDEISLEDLQQLRSADQEWLGELGGELDAARMSPVDLALGGYYAARVAEVARQSRETLGEGRRVPERQIRDWFDSKLITPQGLRSMVLRDAQASQGMDNEVIDRLVSAHLVRAEPRRGLLWYELTHDRFIEPLRQNNSAWFKKNLKPLQRQAMLWEREGRPQGLLMSGEALEEAEAWVGQEAPELTESESELLSASQSAAASARREMRRLRIFVAVVALLALLAGVLAISSFVLRGQALRNESEAFTQQALAITNQDIAMVQEGRATAALATAVVDRANAESNAKIATAALATAVADRAAATAALGEFIAARATADANALAAAAAQGQADEAVSRKLASEALAAAPKDPALASLLSVQSYCAADTFEARNALLTGFQTGVEQQIKSVVNLPHIWNGVNAVAISPVTERLAWVMRDGFAALWNSAEGALEPGFTPPEHRGTLWSVAFSPDGRLLALGGLETQQLSVTDLESGEIVDIGERYPRLVNNQVRDLAFHPTRPWLAVAVLNTVSILDTGSWDTVEIFRTENDYINDIAWSADGNMLVAAEDADSIPPNDGLVAWELNAAGSWSRFSIYQSQTILKAAAFSPDGRYLAAGGTDDLIRLWDTSEFNLVGEPLRGHGGNDVLSLSFSWDGRLLASGGADNEVVIWDTTTLQQVARLQGAFTSDVTGVEFSPLPGSYLLAANANNAARGEIGLFEVSPAKPFYEQLAAPLEYGAVLALGIAENGNPIASVDQAPLDNFSIVMEFSPADGWNSISGGLYPASSAAFDQDGRYLALGSPEDSYALIMDLENPQRGIAEWPTFAIPGNEAAYAPPRSLAFIPYSPQFLDRCETCVSLAAGLCGFATEGGHCAAEQNYILQRNDGSGETWDLKEHSDTITALAYTDAVPSGLEGGGTEEYLASGGLDSTILIWKLVTTGPPVLVRRLQTPAGVTALAFSRDGKFLAAALENRTLQLYQVQSGATPSFLPVGPPLSGAPEIIRAMVFDGANDLYTSSRNGRLLKWPGAPSAWSLRACTSAGRQLTEEEWGLYMGSVPHAPACVNQGEQVSVVCQK